MTHFVTLVSFLVVGLLFVPPASAQVPKEMAVMLSATVVDQPTPRITLQWNKETFQELVYIWRKNKDDASFPVAVLDSIIGGGTQWTDPKITRGVAYEYRVFRYSKAQVGYDSAAKKPIYRWFYATGYILTGIAAPPAPRERMLVLVDSTMLNPLKPGLTLLQQDLENEGWEVTVLGVPRAEAFNSVKVTAVRDLIKREWTDGQKDLGGVFLVGRVPVPYGGNIAPDGHPDHVGAWPADGVYGDVDGVYNDSFTNVMNASRPANENVPGDGKFDPSQWITDVDIPIGRVDFFDMPVFAKSETELLQAYLQKDHAYRTDQWNVKMGGVIDDNFGTYGELFASSAWRSFSVFGADTAVKAGDFFNDLAGPTTMLLGYGCGGGTDVSAGGIGTSTDLATKPVNAVFTMLFGSYFGDWNTKNNFMRSAIATQPRVLTCGWSGRPHWYIHHMALGETIGYSTRISQNNRPIVGSNFGNYTPNIVVMPNGLSVSTTGDRNLHIALMGDPSLRAVTKPVAAIGTVTGQTVYPHKVQLSWTKPTGDVQAYLVYRKLAGARRWTPLTKYPITALTYTDSIVNEGSIQYMVRCCALRKTASGTFYDMGKGRTATVITTDVEEDVVTAGAPAPSISVWPNPATTDANITIGLSTVTNVDLQLVDLTGSVVWERVTTVTMITVIR
ncbi:MAG: hypothetical protein NTX15_11585 [Candidatus Kapabacteria bacterium]|nr:hypothetical protein [Candidatus Kapabacteria bacterium]